jgi:hypothetical protein
MLQFEGVCRSVGSGQELASLEIWTFSFFGQFASTAQDHASTRAMLAGIYQRPQGLNFFIVI